MQAHFPARVSENGRFLLCGDGRPFFYLGDTAWMLFHCLDRTETEHYLQDRARKGFTVIQSVILAELNGLESPNRFGDLPLHYLDPTQPNEAYFEHIDWTIRRANDLGLTVALLPTWGDKWNKQWGAGPEIFTPENAAIYGQWLGARYRDAGVIWVLGGDRPVENETHRAIITGMAHSIKSGDGGRHLMTFHPCGQQTSSQYFHDAEWLDFNMWQTGHIRDRDNYNSIAADYALTPLKPCFDGEPGYEDIPVDFKRENGRLSTIDVRRSLYWALFAGAHGHTYGANSVWQFWDESRESVIFAEMSWREALQLPGASQMQYARRLLASRPFRTRIPDQSLILEGQCDGAGHMQATRDESGSYAFIYFGIGKTVTVDTSKISGNKLHAHWFDPRNGQSTLIGEFTTGGAREFEPPSTGPEEDWVLVLDDARCYYSPPGQGVHPLY